MAAVAAHQCPRGHLPSSAVATSAHPYVTPRLFSHPPHVGLQAITALSKVNFYRRPLSPTEGYPVPHESGLTPASSIWSLVFTSSNLSALQPLEAPKVSLRTHLAGSSPAHARYVLLVTTFRVELPDTAANSKVRDDQFFLDIKHIQKRKPMNMSFRRIPHIFTPQLKAYEKAKG
ncbi:hypothetical protein BDN70DRAFT_892785 [Pholiota conissans]|uniref:Uncharacterized protein n=1 Tax=Pholiota conissans TaxID=109636 RepID=A0A9P5Z6X8_9AGAR|nr:hypothetical protein BDN70DRAFT_892785 [Pholiota conissans]